MVLLRMKVVWSSVRVVPGVLCVMMPGVSMMPLWSVDSWDLQLLVSSTFLHNNMESSVFEILYINYHPTDATAYSLARFGQGSGPIYLDQVGCTGREAMLGDCNANPIGVHDCSHFEDAGVGCQG